MGVFSLAWPCWGLWYGQLFLTQWRTILLFRDFAWMRPGMAALIGCAANPFGLYRIIQPFELHSFVWGQATSLEMWPVTSGIALLPLTWTIAAILVLIMRVRERKYYWLIATLLLLQYLTFCSIRYNMFIGLTLLVITWDGLMHPREPVFPPIFPLAFATARAGVYVYLIAAFINFTYTTFVSKVDMLRDYAQFVYPKSRIVTTSSFEWLREHPTKGYFLLSNLSAGSWGQMPGITGIHTLIDSGTHRYSDRENQLCYYALFSPKTFRLALNKLNVNALTISTTNIYWACMLNTDPDWYLAHIREDSQLYLRRGGQTIKDDRQLFLKWEGEELKRNPLDPDALAGVDSERVVRGLKFRPDSESLNMIQSTSDVIWMTDPQITFVREWLNGLPDNLLSEALKNAGDKRGKCRNWLSSCAPPSAASRPRGPRTGPNLASGSF